MGNNQLGCMNRDNNGVNNIRRITEAVLDNKKRPIRLCRNWKLLVKNQKKMIMNKMNKMDIINKSNRKAEINFRNTRLELNNAYINIHKNNVKYGMKSNKRYKPII